MDGVALRPARERAELFLDTAEAGASVREPALIEKDFWVCWVLGRLFRAGVPVPLLFKGGTSLSKAYRAIERFSEDIDLSIDRRALGFEGDRDPASPSMSGKEARRSIQQLLAACRDFVCGSLLDWLTADFASVLGSPGAAESTWATTIDERDTDRQTLLFRYPATEVTVGASGYYAAEVRLEFGARGDAWPSEKATIRSYVADAFPDEFTTPSSSVRVLAIARTFWEKATILHGLAHGGVRRMRPGQSRHYYDLFCLVTGSARQIAISQLDLLPKVAEHKRRFFRAAWAKYDEARPGTLRLVPTLEVVQKLRTDFREMEAMFFGKPPSFDEIITDLAAFEAELNSEMAPAGGATSGARARV